MESIEGNFDNSEVNELLLYHFKELRSVSPEGSTHVLDIPGLKDPSIKFWSIWEDSKLVGCGAIKLFDQKHGEFKSIRVTNEFRKKGYGEKILKHLLIKARNLNLRKLSIETGSGEFFKPARELFQKIGFKKCPPFAHYKEDPNSCYMNLDI
tara:strand:+ start:194 stop:649 length:456 start_codon:yes stop_codon:yes gene_type:complete